MIHTPNGGKKNEEIKLTIYLVSILTSLLKLTNLYMIIKKNNYQIEKIKKSCKLAAETLEHVQPYIKAGVTTNYLDELISEFIKKNNLGSLLCIEMFTI